MKRLVGVEGGVLALHDGASRAVGRRSRGRDVGRRHARDCVVLLHGFTGSAATWRELGAALRPTRRVIAIDLPGHGATRMNASFDWSLERTAAAVDAALAAVGVERYALLGYSMGGRVALRLALDAPRRVTRLVLESASAGLPAAARARRRRADAALARALERDGIAAFVDRWEALPLFRSLASLPRSRHAALRRQRLVCDPAGLAASLRGMGTGAQPWLGDRAAALTMPVLLVAGTLDRKFTAIARALARRIPTARLALVDGAGHLPHLERPVHFRHLVRAFLDAPARRHPIPEEEHAYGRRLA